MKYFKQYTLRSAMLFVIAFVANSFSWAQEFSPRNGKVHPNNSYELAIFDADPGDVKIKKAQLILEKKEVKKLAKLLERHKNKAQKWEKIAIKEKVKDYTKSFDDYSNIKVFTFLYEFKDKIFGNESHKEVALKYPFFEVNKDGKCYIWIPCDAGSQEVAIDNNIQSTTSVSTSGILVPQTTESHAITREKEIHHIGLMKIRICVSDLEEFISHLNELVDELDNKKNSNKATDKLFK